MQHDLLILKAMTRLFDLGDMLFAHGAVARAKRCYAAANRLYKRMNPQFKGGMYGRCEG